MIYNVIQDFFNNNLIAKIILDSFFIFIFVVFILRFVLKSRKSIVIFVSILIGGFIFTIAYFLDLGISKYAYGLFLVFACFAAIVILAPEIRKELDANAKFENKQETTITSSQTTKIAIADAVMFLSSKKIGALITIEKHNSLDQYADRAIQLNADVSKELLINIFSPLTPLHDGAVIIRGNKIRCAGAYYILTQHDDLDKTTGSRHRAGIGISEVTDSLTIICSEETGNISIATEGFMLKITDRQKLLEYVDMFLK